MNAPQHPRLSKEWWKQEWREWRTTLILVLLILSCRSMFVDWNQVPSGSMQPSILIGDRVFVNRIAFDLRVPFTTWSLARTGEPARGDVIVFWSPATGERLIKRLIGLPGDLIELRGNHLRINGVELRYDEVGTFKDAIVGFGGHADSRVYTEALPGHPHPVGLVFERSEHEFAAMRVPEGEYWMMGDNRDNSADSRFFGPVPRKLLAGRATRVIWSLSPDWEWRWSRFGEKLP